MRSARGPSTVSAHSGHDARQNFARELVAPETVAAAAREIRAVACVERRAQQREAVPRRRVTTHAHGRVLELGLARDGIGDRGDQRADARGARELVAPVHRHEHRARAHVGRDFDAREHALALCTDLREIAGRDAAALRVGGVQLHERLRVVAREPRRFTGARHRVPLIANAAGVQHERQVRGRQPCAVRAARSPRSAPCRRA